MLRVLTGDRPTGKLHLGHYVGSLANRLELQNNYDQFIMVADLQALTDNFDQKEKVTNSIKEVLADYLAVGLNPDANTIFIQSQIPELTELTFYFMNLVNLARLQRNPTLKAERQQKGYEETIPLGFLCYPISQAADITAFAADLVPVGEDQLPMIEQTNEIVRKFNSLYKEETLKECKAVIGKVGRLVGIDGKAKASKSLNNAIFLSDSSEEVKRKVFLMYTDPNHLRVEDPGQLEGNVVFDYLEAFHPNRDQLDELKAHYQRGGLGDATVKSILYKSLEEFLEPIRERRAQLKETDLLEIAREASKKARKIAQETIGKVREAMGLIL
jgi:tryptophanyl-tRNA synthetase